MPCALTKNIISECSIIVIFTKSGYNYVPYLKSYLGMQNKEARELLRVNSRWITIFRECPLTFMTENKIYMNII